MSKKIRFKQDLRRRDKLLQENWYIACQSHQLSKDKPLKRVIYDQNLVLFRDETYKSVTLPDYCLHRHTPLSEGWVKCGKLVCPYHGWHYDGTGRVDYIPSEGVTCKKPHNRRLTSRPTIEQDGFIWVWMGERIPAENQKPWKVPYRKNENWKHYVMETEFDNEVTNLVENFLDVPHTVFVHKGWFRNAINEKMTVDVVTKNGSTLMTYHRQDDKIGFIDRLLNPKQEKLQHTDCFIMPNISKVDYLFGEQTGFFIISQCTPVSSLKTQVYTIISYKIFPGDWVLKPFLNWYTRHVIEQDVNIMKKQGDNLLFTEGTSFSGGIADALHHDIKRLRKLGSETPEKVNDLAASRSVEIWV